MDDVQWRRTLLPLNDSSVQDAIQSLDSSGLKIVLVVEAEQRLIGTISDGDVRRGLLRGLTLDAPIAEIVQRSPFVVPPEMHADTVLQMMRANSLTQMPICDHDRRILGLHIWQELQQARARDNLMVVMAGGRGTRLGHHTADVPKPLVRVGDRPMLEIIIERARVDGFRHFVLALHHMADMIESHFGDGSAFDVDIRYLREDSPLGTAGALSLLSPSPGSPFIVTNADVLTDLRYSDMLDFHSRHAAAATMAVRSYEWQNPFGVVQTKGVDITGFSEKPVTRSYVNAGVYAFEPDALQKLQAGNRCDMPTLFERLQNAGRRTVVYPIHESWLDVGRPDDLEAARKSYL